MSELANRCNAKPIRRQSAQLALQRIRKEVGVLIENAPCPDGTQRVDVTAALQALELLVAHIDALYPKATQ